MREEFNAVKMEVPFAEFPLILERRGLQADPEFGGDCIYQGAILAERLRAAGSDVDFIKDLDSRHISVLARDGKRDFYMDTYLLHQEPVDISDLKELGEKTVDALPIIEGNPSKIIFIPTKHGFEVKYNGYRSKFYGYQELWQSKYDLRKRSPVMPPDDFGNPRFHPRAVLNMRVPFENGDVMKLRWMIANGAREIQVGNIGPTPQNSRSFYERDKFDLEMERLVTRIGTTVPRLISTLQAANDLYHNADPQMIAERLRLEALSALDVKP